MPPIVSNPIRLVIFCNIKINYCRLLFKVYLCLTHNDTLNTKWVITLTITFNLEILLSSNKYSSKHILKIFFSINFKSYLCWYLFFSSKKFKQTRIKFSLFPYFQIIILYENYILFYLAYLIVNEIDLFRIPLILIIINKYYAN